MAAAVIGLAALLAPVASISVARHRAAAAADAAALAGAAVVAGLAAAPEGPCAAAAELAVRGGAALRDCDVDGLVVTVEASVATGLGEVAARATAGPPGER